MLLNCHLLPLEKAWLRFSLCIVVLTLSSVGVGALDDPRAFNEHPYGFNCFLNLMPVEEDIILPQSFIQYQKAGDFVLLLLFVFDIIF